MIVQHLNNVIQEMMMTGVFHDEQEALDILKASLRALRNRIPKREAFHLGTGLPEDLRAFYFQGWHPNILHEIPKCMQDIFDDNLSMD
jgi:uncharacterized protein (DUF2267 family)